MIEYPSILHSGKAPRKNCIAFEKLDGSNIRVKYTRKKGFSLFGSRTQLIDRNHPFLAEVIDIFYDQFENPLVDIIEENWPDEREVVVFGEFFGKKSFAGWHEKDDPTKEFVLFDIMLGHKNRKFLLPQEFLKICQGRVKIPRVIYEGNLTDQFVSDVREGKFDVFEGVVCKGTERTGASRGGIWMAKIKTKIYFELLQAKFSGNDWKQYWE